MNLSFTLHPVPCLLVCEYNQTKPEYQPFDKLRVDAELGRSINGY